MSRKFEHYQLDYDEYDLLIKDRKSFIMNFGESDYCFYTHHLRMYESTEGIKGLENFNYFLKDLEKKNIDLVVFIH